MRYLTFDAAGNVSPGTPTGGFLFSGNGDLGAPVALAVGADEALYYVDIVGRTATGGGQLRRITYNSSNAPPVITLAAASATSSPTAPFLVNFSGAATDPEGQALSYVWNFGDGAQANGANVAHTYNAKGSYNAVLRVSDNLRTSTADPIVINVGAPPVPIIATPADGSSFRAGDVIQIRGSATDADGPLTNDDLRWTLRFGHDTHFHPVLSGVTGMPCAPTGSSCLSFTIPGSGHDFADNTFYEVQLEVTDSHGIKATDSLAILPDKVDLTFASNVPGGVTFFVDGVPRSSPFVLDALIDFQHTISVPSSVVSGGLIYAFSSWSNGPTTTQQTIIVPATDNSYTANFINNGVPATGAYQQAPDGTVSMEAEHFDENVAAGGAWSLITPTGATGGQAMQAGSGGRLEYDIDFNQTGTHYIYVRAFGPNAKTNSVIVGIDGNWTSQVIQVDPFASWQWEGPISINLAGAGVHTIGLATRESGTQVDKIVVLKTAATPSGNGPAESARGP